MLIPADSRGPEYTKSAEEATRTPVLGKVVSARRRRYDGTMETDTKETRTFFNRLNHEYLEIHRRKEDLYWATYTGLGTDKDAFADAERRWTDWLADEKRIASVRDHLSKLASLPDTAERRELEKGLQGWAAFMEAHSFASTEAKGIWEEAITASAELFDRRSRHSLSYIDESGKRSPASLSSLVTNVRTAKSEAVRKGSHEALRGLEDWVLENGLLELVKLRNRFARASGFENYFEYSVRKNERMSVAQLFEVLDDLLEGTEENHSRALEELRAASGADTLRPHNAAYGLSGKSDSEVDAYSPFAAALERWVSSFSRLGIDFGGAELTLDLLERKGKHENGFCHGPIPSYLDDGSWVPAKVNFTSNAQPNLAGSGKRGLRVLFHEGGHAAHFANIRMNSPCFSQEFAPSSMALAETQSMFCESLIVDGDWLALYAKDADNRPIPSEVIVDFARNRQKGLSFDLRVFLTVPYFERALYELPEHELTSGKVKMLARGVEERIFGMDANPRPVLAVPHLLANESACAYQGYLLALVGVHQTRAHLLKTLGYLTDNPAVGPLLAKHFWNPGNSLSPDDALRSLTGEPLNARYLAEVYSRSGEEAAKVAAELAAAALDRPRAEGDGLNASIRVVDGPRVIASNEGSNEELFRGFEAFVQSAYPRTPGADTPS